MARYASRRGTGLPRTGRAAIRSGRPAGPCGHAGVRPQWDRLGNRSRLGAGISARSGRHEVALVRSGDRISALSADSSLYAFGASPLASYKAVAVDPQVLDRYAGEYDTGFGLKVSIARQGDHLLVSAPQP